MPKCSLCSCPATRGDVRNWRWTRDRQRPRARRGRGRIRAAVAVHSFSAATISASVARRAVVQNREGRPRRAPRCRCVRRNTAMVIGGRKLARGRPSGASSRDGGASSRRAAAGFPAISNNVLLERVERHTVGVSGPPVRSTASAGADLDPASRRRARSETVAARAAGTELQRAAGQRRPYEPLRHGVTAGGPPGGAHIARLGLSAPHPEVGTVSPLQPARNRCRKRSYERRGAGPRRSAQQPEVNCD